MRLPRTTHGSRSAFTLPELLMVMMIIAVLLGIILSAIRAVHRHALRTVALGEVKGIEAAWKQYYAHYQEWPDLSRNSGGSSGGDSGLSGDTTFLINKDVALAMQGDEDDGKDKINPDDIPLMEFIHFDENGNPINPWGLKIVDVNRCYFVRFDHDGDGRIALPDASAGEAQNRSDETWQPASYSDSDTDEEHFVRAGVIVWTYNPEILLGKKDGEGKSTDEFRIIGSWKD